MKILLDTCEALWFLAGDEKLTARYQRAFTDPSNQLFLSVVSDWEVALKHSTGRLPLAQPPEYYLSSGRSRFGIQTLPLFSSPTYLLEHLPKHHKDPFDRMLICQAKAHGLVLATSDPLIHQYPVPIL